jgi:hypothetical protein
MENLRKDSLALIERVQNVIEGYDFPLTLRQIYYQLVARQVIPNLQKYYAKLSRVCVTGRDLGLLPEDSFADRLRELQKPTSWSDLQDYSKTVKSAYRRDKWSDQDKYLEIWTEKDALRGVISPITAKWDIGLLVVRGQVSRTAIYKAYQRYSVEQDEEKKCYLFYFGDFDPSGLSIFESLKERISNFEDGYLSEVNFQRLALTQEQINKYSLPQDPAKTSDPNYRRFTAEYGDNVVELDSLPPDVLRGLVEGCIKDNLDMGRFEHVLKTEEEEKEELGVLLEAL